MHAAAVSVCAFQRFLDAESMLAGRLIAMLLLRLPAFATTNIVLSPSKPLLGLQSESHSSYCPFAKTSTKPVYVYKRPTTAAALYSAVTAHC
jgi:hypothetical protein